MARPTHHACVVIGGGPAGLAAAATLALAGLDVALAAGSSPGTGRAAGSRDAAAAAETRTAALFPPAIALLERLGAWGELAPLCAPLTAIRLVDSSGSVLKAPQIVFSAGDLGLSNLGYNVPNDGLVEALRGAARRLGVTVLDNGLATSVRAGADIAHVDLVGGQQISADLLVAADGRGSATREAAGIAVRRWTYEQAALSCRFHHSRPHGGVSTELHGPAGPCTTVPLPGNASSLVWMDHPTEIERLKALPVDAFLVALSRRLEGLLGTLSELGPRQSFALSGMLAQRMGQNRTALVGEAAHALPPIGAQGLNLGLVDAAVLAGLAGDALVAGQDVGSAGLLARYDSARAGDVRRRASAVDLLNRSVNQGLVPLHLLRGAGLHVLASSATLRRRLMREGLFPPDPMPPLMQCG